jgi:hypothetical protein
LRAVPTSKRPKAAPKPVLYFDVGAFVVERQGAPAKAAYAQTFLDAVKGRFKLRLLSSLEEHVARARLKLLRFEPEYVPYRRALGKASAIDFRTPFYWIDDDPTPADLLRLADERASDRVITITKRDGVTEQTLKKLLATLEEHTAAAEAR